MCEMMQTHRITVSKVQGKYLTISRPFLSKHFPHMLEGLREAKALAMFSINDRRLPQCHSCVTFPSC